MFGRNARRMRDTYIYIYIQYYIIYRIYIKYARDDIITYQHVIKSFSGEHFIAFSHHDGARTYDEL